MIKSFGITHVFLLSVLHYEPSTGVFTWRDRPGSKFKKSCVGKVAGAVTSKGYIRIRILSVNYYAHQLAYFYVHGEQPLSRLEHIDGDKTNNTISNIRETDYVLTAAAYKPKSSTFFKGVSQRGNRFQARIQHTYIGAYDSAEEAHDAYCEVAKEIFGDRFIPHT